jgi:hypothetical protein
MKKTLLLLGLLCFLSCNVVSIHNFSNDRRWKKKKFKSKTYVNLNYNPILLDSINSKGVFLAGTYSYDLESQKLKPILITKLKKRNIHVSDTAKSTLEITTLIANEFITYESIYGGECDSEYLGDHESYKVELAIIGTISKDTIKREVASVYKFTSEPRESYIFNELIAYSNPNVDLEKVINNMINSFSVQVYDELIKD